MSARSKTLDRLREIPTLAALVAISADAPTRGAAGCGRANVEAPLPSQIVAWDLLRADGQWTPMGVLIEACVTVHDEMRDEEVRPAMPDATFGAICAWLADDLAVCYWTTDDVLADWVGSAASYAHHALKAWVGEQDERLWCVHCSGVLELIASGEHGERHVLCRDCGHVYSSRELAHLAELLTPATLPEIAEMLGVERSTVWRWARAWGIEPVSTHAESPRRPALYRRSDFERFRGIAAA